MAEKELSPVFAEIKKDYLQQIIAKWDDIDLEALGLTREQDAIQVPFFHLKCTVTKQGITGDGAHLLGHMVNVVISNYLLAEPGPPPSAKGWVSYKDFADAAPYWGGYNNVVERKIATDYSGRLEVLKAKCLALGGREPEQSFSYDLALEFQALPMIALLLLFNDAEDMFPAQCSVLLQDNASKFFDMECLAMLGIGLSTFLTGQGEQS